MRAGGGGFLQLNSNVKVTFDGNSLVAGNLDGKLTYPQQTMLQPQIANRGVSFVNLGIGGQSTRMMDGLDGGSAADVDAAWASGKRNVLVVWEFTNDVAFYGKTVEQGIINLGNYIYHRKHANPWNVVLLTCLPRYQTGNDALLVQFNAIARKRYREWGVDVLVDVRAPGSLFNFDGTVAGNFTAQQMLWSETSNWVHLSEHGYGVIGRMVAAGLRRLPARAPVAV